MLLADGLPTGRLQRVPRKIPDRARWWLEFTKTRLKTAIAAGRPIRYVLAGEPGRWSDGRNFAVLRDEALARRGSGARPRTIPTAAPWATPPSAKAAFWKVASPVARVGAGRSQQRHVV